MRWILPAALVAISLASSGAAACDLAAPVPGPGHFFLYDRETGNEIDVPVQGRWLGAGCELSNPFAFDGKRLVWTEGPERADAQQTLRLRTEQGNIRTLQTTPTPYHELGLTSTHVYYLSGTSAATTLNRQSLNGGAPSLVTTDVPRHATLNGPIAAWFSPDGKRVNVYDAETGDWILRDQTLAQLGVQDDDQGQLFAFDADSLFFSTFQSSQTPTTFRYWTYEVESKRLREVENPHDPYGAWIFESTLYWVEFDSKHEAKRLKAQPIGGGPAQDLGLLPHELGARLVVVGDHVVLASYRHTGEHQHGPTTGSAARSSEAGSEPVTVPFAGALAAPLVLFGLALLVRRKYG